MENKKKIEELKELVGSEKVLESPPALLTYARDASPIKGSVPIAVVKPGSIEEVQEVVKWANRTKTPLYPRSSPASGERFR